MAERCRRNVDAMAAFRTKVKAELGDTTVIFPEGVAWSIACSTVVQRSMTPQREHNSADTYAFDMAHG